MALNLFRRRTDSLLSEFSIGFRCVFFFLSVSYLARLVVQITHLQEMQLSVASTEYGVVIIKVDLNSN